MSDAHSKIQFKIDAAFEQCCTRGLEIITVDSKEELKCLAEFLGSKTNFLIAGRYFYIVSEIQCFCSFKWVFLDVWHQNR